MIRGLFSPSKALPPPLNSMDLIQQAAILRKSGEFKERVTDQVGKVVSFVKNHITGLSETDEQDLRAFEEQVFLAQELTVRVIRMTVTNLASVQAVCVRSRRIDLHLLDISLAYVESQMTIPKLTESYPVTKTREEWAGGAKKWLGMKKTVNYTEMASRPRGLTKEEMDCVFNRLTQNVLHSEEHTRLIA
jgi:hypothetical protein